MFAMLPASKRRWQRVGDDSHGEELQQGDEDEDEKSITDRTRLFNAQSSTACAPADANASESDEGIHGLRRQARDGDGFPAEFMPKCQANMRVASSLAQSKHGEMQISAFPALSIRKRCDKSSWQSFKQILHKQFTPPFPFGKNLMLMDDLQHRRHRRNDRAGHTSSNVLTASTNTVELRKLNSQIQNGLNKSAFVASSKKGKTKENFSPNYDHKHGASKSSIKLRSTDTVMKNQRPNAERVGSRVSSGEPFTEKHILKAKSRVFKTTNLLVKAEDRILLGDASEP